MAMKIVFRNVLRDGLQRFEVVSIENIMKYADLPYEYLHASGSSVYRATNGSIQVYPAESGNFGFNVGDVVTDTRKDLIIKTMQEAGERLTKINDKIRELKKNWEGNTESFII